MILSFPSPLQKFQVCIAIPKNARIHYAHVIGSAEMVIASPVELQPNDYLWVDTRNGHVMIVERTRIVIWRAGWLN